MSDKPTSMSGRRAEAARNDQTILEAARAIFISDPNAPIAAVAERAGVGIGALYRRYRSKDILLQRLALDGLRRYIAEVEAALDDEGEPWAAFSRFMHSALDAGTGSLTIRLAGTFIPGEELQSEGQKANASILRLVERTKAAGALRPDIEAGDISLIFEQLQAIQVGDQQRTQQLRHRQLALLLDALHLQSAAPLPGTAPNWEEMRQRYDK